MKRPDARASAARPRPLAAALAARPRPLAAALAAGALLLTACGGGPAPSNPTTSPTAPQQTSTGGTEEPEDRETIDAATLRSLKQGDAASLTPRVTIGTPPAGYHTAKRTSGQYTTHLVGDNGCELATRVFATTPPQGVYSDRGLTLAWAPPHPGDKPTEIRLPDGGPQIYWLTFKPGPVQSRATASYVTLAKDQHGALAQVGIDIVMACPAPHSPQSELRKAALAVQVQLPAKR